MTNPRIGGDDARRLVETLVPTGPHRALIAPALCALGAAAITRGVTLVRADTWTEILALNEQHRADWFPLLPQPATAPMLWIGAADGEGDLVAVQAATLMDCTGRNFAGRLRDLTAFHDDPAVDAPGDWCFVASPLAEETTGSIALITSGWTRPDWRGRGLFHLVGRAVRLVALDRWAVRWVVGLVDPGTVPQWSPEKAGHRHLDEHPTILLHQRGVGRLPLHLLRFSKVGMLVNAADLANRPRALYHRSSGAAAGRECPW